MEVDNKKYTVDFRYVHNEDEAHNVLRETFGFDDFYGMNLDALNDCLGELDWDIFVYFLIDKDNEHDFFDDIINIFAVNNISYKKVYSQVN